MPIANPGYSQSKRRVYGTRNLVDVLPGGGASGVVATVHGLVRVDSRGIGTDTGRTTLAFVWDGQIYERVFGKGYRRQFLAVLANRFAADVVSASMSGRMWA